MAGEGLELAARALPFPPFPLEGARGDRGTGRCTPALEINENLRLLHEDF